MTYLEFLIIFIIPLVTAGLIYYTRTPSLLKSDIKEACLFLMFMALIYTTPWDNYLVKTGVWSYEEHNILFRIGYVPFEEYCFFILQTVLTSSWCLFIFNRFKLSKHTGSHKPKYTILSTLMCLFILSLFLLYREKSRYLALILVWALPVFILQWTVGGQHLIKNIKVYIFALLPPTFYLWVIDGYAIYRNIWAISDSQTLGIKFSYLPIEEAVFFLATNVMLCQGLILYMIMKQDLINSIKGNKLCQRLFT